jgi:hypothetical protein
MTGGAIPRPRGTYDTDVSTTRKDERVTRLKQQVALGRYQVDADAVAGEILSKLRLMERVRRSLRSDPSVRRNPQTPIPRPG